jgi:hypothetical protein
MPITILAILGLAIATVSILSTLVLVAVAAGGADADDWPGWVSDHDPWETDAGS